MDRGNQSLVPEFILLGFSITPQIRIVLFVVFLLALLVTLATNSFIITIIRADSQLHTPMYFFLCNLSLLDICFLITNVPTCLKGFVSTKNSIAYSSCVAQVLVGLSLGIAQCVLLAVMAWDRYVAICKPFSYQRLMSRPMCISLAMATWACGILLSVAQTPSLLNVRFCGHHKINHVVCEMAAILHLSCTDIHIFQVVIFVISVVILVSPLSLIILTYVPIIFTIVCMPTSSSKHRACSTCGSHLMVVSLFYGTMIVMYVRPGSITSRDNEKVISVFYGLVTPALNPLIYTLRNKEVKQAVQRRLNRIKARAAVEKRIVHYERSEVVPYLWIHLLKVQISMKP